MTGGRRGYGRLDRPTIVATGTVIARTEGLSALTMRRIADELRCSPMGLYRHVADRRALLLAMLDEVGTGLVFPPPDPDPRAEIHAIIGRVHEVLRDDPWVITVLLVDGLASPAILPAMDRLIAALDSAGISGGQALSSHMLLWQYVYGEVLTTYHENADAWNRRMVVESDPTQFPALHGAMRLAAADGEPADRFRHNLDTILDGLFG